MDYSSRKILPAYRYLTDARETRAALNAWQASEVIGLDTETFWDNEHKHSHVSLVQLASLAAKEILVIDALSIGVEYVRALVESPDIRMAAHNARFDEAVLQHAGLHPLGFIDTLRLAREALRLSSYSLQAVVEHLFGIALDKSFQKSDWRRRPLTASQLAYAATDAHITLRVYEELIRLLPDQNRLDKALLAATLKPSEANSEEGRTPRKRRAPYVPPRALTEAERRAVTQLKKWRLDKSFEARLPAYMICPDRTLEQLILDRPETLDQLSNIHGLGASKISRYGEELLQKLKEVSALIEDSS